mgnify:FL=1
MNLELIYLIMFLLIISLVLINSYSIFKLSKEIKKTSLIELDEFNDIHPMMKDLYFEVILHGILPYKHKQVADFLKKHNFDQWYDKNRTHLLKIIATYKYLLQNEKNIENFNDIIIEINHYITQYKNALVDIEKNITIDNANLSKLFNADLEKYNLELKNKYKLIKPKKDTAKSN